MKNNHLIALIASIVVCSGVGFSIGRQTASFEVTVADGSTVSITRQNAQRVVGTQSLESMLKTLGIVRNVAEGAKSQVLRNTDGDYPEVQRLATMGLDQFIQTISQLEDETQHDIQQFTD